MSRKLNVLVPVVAAVPAETTDEAVSALRGTACGTRVRRADGEPGCGAFESQDSEEPA
jgi:hypothetical protein